MSTGSASVRRPSLVIKPPSRWAPVNFKELWEFRDLFTRLAARDITLRYRQTALGVIWVVLQPLMAAGVFSFVFGRVAGLSSEGVPYFVYSFAGLTAWNAFNATIGKASSALVGNSAMVSKVYFPRMVLPLSTLGSTSLDFAVSSAMMLVLLGVYGVGYRLSIVAILPLYLVVQLMACGVGLMAGALMVRYRDVGYVVPVVTQVLLYATPVAYGLAALPRASLRPFFTWNPLTGLFEAFRWALLGTKLETGLLVYSVVVAVLLFVAGAFQFTRMERQFADVI